MTRIPPDALAQLRKHLDYLLETAPYSRWIQRDPIRFPRRFTRESDREIVALFAALMAYGRVSAIGDAMESVLRRNGDHPSQLCAQDSEEAGRQRFSGFVYRVTRGVDLARLWLGLGALLREHGSILSALQRFDTDHAPDFRNMLGKFRAEIMNRTPSFEDRRGFKHFMPNPTGGSAIKRYNMLMRWMVRGPEAVDIGDWNILGTHRLVLPLDTHTHSIARKLGLTERVQANWQTTAEITDILRMLCPEDPVRYDFALAHLGISGDIQALNWQNFVSNARIKRS